MKRYIGKLLCAGLGMILLVGTVGCFSGGEKEPEEIVQATAPSDGGEETIVMASGAPTADTNNPLPSESPETVTTAAPEPTPEPTPMTTRPPMEGDVSTGRFPAYDTGTEADWSYQSDELRIAIKRHEDEEDQIVYYVADIWVRNISSFRMGFGHGEFNSGPEEPESFAVREHAIFGISGSYNSGLVIHNGKVVKKNVEKSDNSYRSGVLIIYQDGSVKTINYAKKETYNYDKEKKLNGGIWHALQFGPILVQNGEIQSGLKTRERQPRIIFGYCEPGHYIAVAVDGRTKKSIGMTEQEMAELMQSLGCTDAMNLDGGYSAAMLFMGKTINVPAQHTDKDGDKVSGRNIKDLLAFAEYDKDGNAPELSLVTPDKVREETP